MHSTNIASTLELPNKENEGHYTPRLFSHEEYALIERWLKAQNDRRYEKQITGKKRKNSSNLAIEQILPINTNLHPVLKINDHVYGIGFVIGEGSYGKVKWVENAEGKRFVLKSAETTLEAQNVSSQPDKSSSSSDSKSSYKMPVRKVRRTNNYEPSPSILRKVMFREAEVLQLLNRGGQLFERIVDRENPKIQYNILMELIPGITVSELIKQGKNNPLPKSTYYQLALLIGEELSNLHQIGFYHGDLKPGNIIFNFETMEVKLIDFGSATKIGSNETRIWTKGIADPSSIARSTIETEIYELGVTWALLLGFVELKTGIMSYLDWSEPPTDITDLKLYNFIKESMMNRKKDQRPNLASALNMMKLCLVEESPKATTEKSSFTNPSLLFSSDSDCNNPNEPENKAELQNAGCCS